MATFIKAGFWEKLCKPCKGYKGWLNLDEFVDSRIPAPTPPAYKVYTALLTQSGGDVPRDKAQGDSLDLGITYLIDANSENADLTIFGAPNSNVGTYFVCTNAGTLPSIGSISLSWNEGTPVATVLENTIGNIWFAYGNAGSYAIFSDGLFSTIDKCFVLIPSLMSPSQPDVFIGQKVIYGNETSIILQTFGIEVGSIALSDDGLYNTPIEIRVYN